MFWLSPLWQCILIYKQRQVTFCKHLFFNPQPAVMAVAVVVMAAWPSGLFHVTRTRSAQGGTMGVIALLLSPAAVLVSSPILIFPNTWYCCFFVSRVYISGLIIKNSGLSFLLLQACKTPSQPSGALILLCFHCKRTSNEQITGTPITCKTFKA